jgi:hypothetical protein
MYQMQFDELLVSINVCGLAVHASAKKVPWVVRNMYSLVLNKVCKSPLSQSKRQTRTACLFSVLGHIHAESLTQGVAMIHCRPNSRALLAGPCVD